MRTHPPAKHTHAILCANDKCFFSTGWMCVCLLQRLPCAGRCARLIKFMRHLKLEEISIKTGRISALAGQFAEKIAFDYFAVFSTHGALNLDL